MQEKPAGPDKETEPGITAVERMVVVRNLDPKESEIERLTEEQLRKLVPCGPDPEWHLRAIHEYADAGFDHVYVHQIGHDQEGFFRFYEREVLPKL